MKKISFDKMLNLYSYLLIFLIFMGPTFLKFQILGIQFNVARVAMLFMMIALIIKFIVARENFKIKSKELKYVIAFYIIWAIYSVVSGLWCKDMKMYVITNFYVITGVAGILFFTFCVNVKENLERYFYIMQVGVLVSSIYYFFIKETYIGGFYHNTNDLATVLVFLFPITIYLLYNANNVFEVICQFILCIIYYYIFVLIDSRACSLGMELGAILTVALICLKNKENILKDDKLKRVSISLLMILCIGSFNGIVPKVGEISSVPVEEKNSEGEIVEVSTSNDIRTNLIYNAIEFLKIDGNWWHGIGTGNSIYYMKNYAKYNTREEYSLHNYWVDILLCFGGIILFGYIMVYILLCKNLLKEIEIKQNFIEMLKNKNIIFLFFLLSFILASISSSTILTREWLWIAFGIMIAWIRNNEVDRR